MSTVIECALSGLLAGEDALEEVASVDDEASGLPVGWTQVTITRRLPNPNHETVQAAKLATFQGLLSQIPKKSRKQYSEIVALQVEAQFAALEDRPGNQPTVLDTVTVFLASPDEDPSGELGTALDDLAESLGLEEGFFSALEDAPEEGAGEGEESEEGEEPPATEPDAG